VAGELDNTETSEDILLTDTVQNILFAGVNNALLGLLIGNGLFNNKLPPAIQDNGFAIFNAKNGSIVNENYKLSLDPERYGDIVEWGQSPDNLIPNLSTARTCPSTIDGHAHDCGRSDPYWWPYPDIDGNVEESACNILRGNIAEQYPSEEYLMDNDIWMFSTDYCRSVPFTYTGDVEIGNIMAHRYTIVPDWGQVNKTNNVCTCKDLDERKNRDCWEISEDVDELDLSGCEITTCHDGLHNVENCFKAPSIMGSPHFYMAEDQLSYFDESFTKPSVENDASFMDVDPLTGTVLRATMRYQISMPVVPIGRDEIAFLENIPSTPAFPVLWWEETTFP